MEGRLPAPASGAGQACQHCQQGSAAMMERRRWVSCAACIAVESLTGIMYMFALYSPLLKARYDLTQAELDGLATATNIVRTTALQRRPAHPSTPSHSGPGRQTTSVCGSGRSSTPTAPAR